MKKLFREHWAIAALSAVYFVILWITAPAMGFTRDEGYYFKAADEYYRWFQTLASARFFDAFGDAEITRTMSYNTEHPALLKMLFGLSYNFFHKLLGLGSPAQGYRLVGFAYASLSLVATYLLGLRMVSKSAGILAALMLASMPRYFYDAHLACFDVPMTAMWALAIVTFHDALLSDRNKEAIIAGLVFGLALATKLNALFLPPIFVLTWLLSKGVLGGVRFVPGPSGASDLALPKVPRVMFALAILGPIVFVALWPYLWHDTFQRIGAYIGFHMRHEHYPISYFGALLVKPPFPWSFPFVMSYFTIPSPILFLGMIGFVVALYRTIVKRSPTEALLVLATFVPIFLIAMPSTPIFGGVKHWYNAMPTLAVLAARAGLEGIELLGRLGRARYAAAALAILPGALGIAASHPNGIGYYNELAGGYAGGAELGMQRGFWGGLAFPMYPTLEELPKGSRVFFNRTNYDSYNMYRRENVFPPHIYYANEPKNVAASFVFEQPEHGEKEAETWTNLGTRPVRGVYQDNVTLSQEYVSGASRSPP